MTLLVLILPVVIILTWARRVRPGRRKLEGARIASVPIPVLARARMHLGSGALAMAVAVILATIDAVSWWILIVPALSYILMVLPRMHYTLTDAGIRLGLTEFRRWTEFAAVRRAPGGARLIGVQRGRGMHVWLSGSRGDDEFIHFLKQTMQGAYKGDSRSASVSEDQRGSTHAGAASQAPGGFSAFTADGHVTELLVTNRSAPPEIEPVRR